MYRYKSIHIYINQYGPIFCTLLIYIINYQLIQNSKKILTTLQQKQLLGEVVEFSPFQRIFSLLLILMSENHEYGLICYIDLSHKIFIQPSDSLQKHLHKYVYIQQYLLRSYYVLSGGLGSVNIQVKKTDMIPVFTELLIHTQT